MANSPTPVPAVRSGGLRSGRDRPANCGWPVESCCVKQPRFATLQRLDTHIAIGHPGPMVLETDVAFAFEILQRRAKLVAISFHWSGLTMSLVGARQS